MDLIDMPKESWYLTTKISIDCELNFDASDMVELEKHSMHRKMH